MTAVAAEIKPKIIPEAPAVTIVEMSVFEPMEIVIKNVIIGCAVEHAFLNSLSTFPQIKPINSGTSVATKLIKGIEANPVAPNATKVKNGPSLSDRIEIAPVSVAFPNCDYNEMYKEPFEFVMAAINTNGVIPRKPVSPKTFPTKSPKATPNKNFIPVKVIPLYNGIPTCLIFIAEPHTIKNSPIIAALPL